MMWLWLAVGCDGCSSPPSPSRPVVIGPTLSVLTYNVNFEREDPATIEAIVGADADLVLLQETTPGWEAAIRARLGDRYPHIEFRDHLPDGGMAVLAKAPFVSLPGLVSPVGGFPAWCLDAESPVGRLRVLHAHLHPPLDENGLFTGYFTTTGLRATELRSHVSCFEGGPDVVAGDLNEEVGDAVDVLVDAGFFDAASAFAPVTRTWAWQLEWWELTGRPDHVFSTGGLFPVEVEVIEAGASDHRPLRVVLGRSARAAGAP